MNFIRMGAMCRTISHLSVLISAMLLLAMSIHFAPSAYAQNGTGDETLDEPGEEGIVPELPPPGDERPAEPKEEPIVKPLIPPAERIEGGAAREGETRWNVDITGAVIMSYVFNDSPDSFTIKYRWEVKGQANATTAVIRGDADMSAEVEGPLSKWPTGECRLSILIPKIPFELTFKKPEGGKGNIKLVFKRQISEDWQSKCTFTDAPGAKFETRGGPEAWLTKALDKARPPLKDIVADIGDEETTTRFVISKETIVDPPLGSGEIEGTGVITIKPGGE